MWQKISLAVVLVVVIWQSRLGANQWLLGWDSLVPELNLQVNFERVTTGVWQEYQGVGLPGGMAHLADLSRMVILWMFDLVVSTNYVRWIWHIGMLILGPIGIWYMGRKLWKWNESACLVSSVFYLLNLAAVQYFFVPYETFSSFYGFLPWIVSSYLTYLESGQRKDLASLAVISLLATSSFYVQTLFVVLVITLAVLTVPYWRRWRRVLGAGSTILAVNAFWLLPAIYGVMQGGSFVGVAKINSIGSPETALMNTAYGGWRDVVSLRGYWLEWVEWMGGSAWGRMMQSWWVWAGQGWVERAGLALFGGSLMGLGWGVLRGKIKWGWLAGMLLAYIMMASFNAPFGFVYSWLVIKVPLFGEMFRSVFTKWSIVLALFASVGVGSLVNQMRNKWVGGIVGILLIGGIGLVVWPVLKLGIIFDKMKVDFPSEYFKIFEFMKTHPKDGRVAYLPAQDMWSWKYTDWGYRGSGFLWYGIEQPILDRAFDVWSPYNEGFYNELSTALYGCDKTTLGSDPPAVESAGWAHPLGSDREGKLQGCEGQVARVLDKYDVRYVLLDESVIAPGQDKEILRIEETKKIARGLGWERVFSEGFLSVWDTESQSSVKDSPFALQASPSRDCISGIPSKDCPWDGSREQRFISAPGSYTRVAGDTSKVREDVIYRDVGTYVTRVTQGSDLPAMESAGWDQPLRSDPGVIAYPFAQLMREEIKSIGYTETGVTIGSDLPADESAGWGQSLRSDPGGQELIIPGWQVGDIVQINYQDGEAVPAYSVNGQAGPRFLGKEKPEEGKSYILARVSEGEEWREYRSDQEFGISNQEIVIEVQGKPFVYDFASQGQGTIGNCDVLKRGASEKRVPKGSDLPAAESAGWDQSLRSDPGEQGAVYTANERGAVCDYVVMDELFTRLPYLMRVQGENRAGRSVKFFLWNTGSKRNDIEWLMNGRKSQSIGSDLPAAESAGWDQPLRSNPGVAFDQTFGLLPWEWDGYYTLNIETRSFGQYAENEVRPVEVRYFPLAQIAWARVVPQMGERQGSELSSTLLQSALSSEPSSLKVTGVEKTGTWLYRVKVEGSGLLKLSQGYDEGWISLDLAHVRVDGWANGWIIPHSGTATIFYWPQLLEYLGFALLGMTVVVIWRYEARK